MVQFESSVKHVPYTQERVYTKLADLNNLASVREKLGELKEKFPGKVEDLVSTRIR